MLESLIPDWLPTLFEKHPALWTIGALALLALILAGCGAVARDQSLPDAIGDKFYPATTHEERVVRFCFATLAVSELVADRVTSQDRADAPAALGLIEVAISHIDALTAENPGWFRWTNTELYEATVALGRGVAAANKRRLIGALTLGPSPSRIFTVLLAGGKSKAMRLDFDKLWHDMTAGVVGPTEVIALCRMRIDRNYSKVRMAAGLTGVGRDNLTPSRSALPLATQPQRRQ